MKVAFKAMIKAINNKSLVSGDKATRITLEFDSTLHTQTLNDLNMLHFADKNIMVVLMDDKE